MENKKSKLNYLLVFFVIFLIALQVFALNSNSTMGDELTEMEKKVKVIETDNNRLSQKIASLSSMATIGEKAKLLGLGSSVRVLSLTTALPLASNLKLSL